MNKIEISFILNGDLVKTSVYPNITLLSLLREGLGITSVKSSCVQGECGACTVIIDGEAMNSCLVLAPTVNGKTVETVESLGDVNNLHPLQKAFHEIGAFQCGFCTPGFIMSAKALLDKNPNPTKEDVKVAMSGNICRCTGYVKPVDAILKAANEMNKSDDSVGAVIDAANLLRGER